MRPPSRIIEQYVPVSQRTVEKLTVVPAIDNTTCIGRDMLYSAPRRIFSSWLETCWALSDQNAASTLLRNRLGCGLIKGPTYEYQVSIASDLKAISLTKSRHFFSSFLFGGVLTDHPADADGRFYDFVLLTASPVGEWNRRRVVGKRVAAVFIVVLEGECFVIASRVVAKCLDSVGT